MPSLKSVLAVLVALLVWELVLRDLFQDLKNKL